MKPYLIVHIQKIFSSLNAMVSKAVSHIHRAERCMLLPKSCGSFESRINLENVASWASRSKREDKLLYVPPFLVRTAERF